MKSLISITQCKGNLCAMTACSEHNFRVLFPSPLRHTTVLHLINADMLLCLTSNYTKMPNSCEGCTSLQFIHHNATKCIPTLYKYKNIHFKIQTFTSILRSGV
jgi:hypothetical protein